MATDLPTRARAIAIIEDGRARIDELLERLPPAALIEPGVGGGTWSPKDLIGHLASWEEHALDALDAWSRDERAPIDDLWFTLSTSALNDQAVRRKASWSLARVQRESEQVHDELLAAIRNMTDVRWRGPATSRGRKPLGARVGAILQGSRGAPFAHDAAHVKSLGSFVAAHAGP